MGTAIFLAQSNTGHPFVNEPSILPGADMIGVIDPARKSEFVNRSASAFEPGQNADAGGFEELKLNRLDDDRA